MGDQEARSSVQQTPQEGGHGESEIPIQQGGYLVLREGCRQSFTALEAAFARTLPSGPPMSPRAPTARTVSPVSPLTPVPLTAPPVPLSVPLVAFAIPPAPPPLLARAALPFVVSPTTRVAGPTASSTLRLTAFCTAGHVGLKQTYRWPRGNQFPDPPLVCTARNFNEKKNSATATNETARTETRQS